MGPRDPALTSEPDAGNDARGDSLTLSGLARTTLGSILVLATLQFGWLMTVPLAIFWFGTGISLVVPLLGGSLVELARQLLQQRLRRRLRVSCMLRASTAALNSPGGVAEASAESAFWFGHIAEYAVSIDAPAIAACSAALASVLLLASSRVGLSVVVPAALVLSVATALGVGLNRRRVPAIRRFVERRQDTANWMAAAVRDRGEISPEAARQSYFARVTSAARAWAHAEDHMDQSRMLHRLLLIAFVIGGLGAVAELSGLELGGLAAASSLKLGTVTDALLLGSALPLARLLVAHVDSLLVARAELAATRARIPRVSASEFLRLPARPRQLSLQGVVVRYGDQAALEIDELRVGLSAPLGILGPNGSGKTTLASLIAGVLGPTTGSVALDGITASAVSRDQVAFVPQDPVLVEALSIEDNVRLVSPQASPDAIGKALVRLGLSPDLGRLCGSLSRGEQQRIAVARALLREPLLLVLDEPDAWLDTQGRGALLDVLREQAERCAVIVVSHRSDMLPLLGWLLLLNETHRVEACGAPAEVRGHSSTLDRAAKR